MTLPRGWEEKRLDQWGEIVSGSTPSTTVPAFWDGGIVWVTPFDLSRLTTAYLTDSNKRIAAAGLNACSAQLLPPGSIVLSSRAPIGYVALPTVPFCTNQGCKTVKLNDGIDSRFAYYNILFNIDKIKSLGEGTTFAEISKAALSRVLLSFPTNPAEQVKIAEVLSAVDRVIERTETAIAKQRRINVGVVNDLLTVGIDAHGNIRTERTHQFQDSPAGRIPVGWTPSTLEHVGTWHSGGTPSKANPAYWGDQIPWLCPKDMRSFDVATTTDRLTAAGALHGSRQVAVNSVFIVVRGMILAHTFPVSISSVPMSFNQDVKAIEPAQHVVPRFLAYWFLSNGPQLLKLTTTATHGTKRFDMRELFDVPIGLPKEAEQAAIVKRLDSASRHITATIKTAAKLRSLKAGLMQDLLTGRRRLTALLPAAGRDLEQAS